MIIIMKFKDWKIISHNYVTSQNITFFFSPSLQGKEKYLKYINNSGWTFYIWKSLIAANLFELLLYGPRPDFAPYENPSLAHRPITFLKSRKDGELAVAAAHCLSLCIFKKTTPWATGLQGRVVENQNPRSGNIDHCFCIWPPRTVGSDLPTSSICLLCFWRL